PSLLAYPGPPRTRIYTLSLHDALPISAAEAAQSTAVRQQILASADALANRFNQLAGNLDMQERQISEQTEAQVDTINSQLKNVARLNERIADIQAKGGNTAQLRSEERRVG